MEGDEEAMATTWSNLTFDELVAANREQFERLEGATGQAGAGGEGAEDCAALAGHWDRFYQKNKAAFFRDRHYFGRDYPELATLGPAARACEWGCGAGNTVWGLLREHQQWSFEAFDCSPAAVALVKDRADARVSCRVWDPAAAAGPEGSPLPPQSLDVSLLIFFLSALGEEAAVAAVARHCHAATRPGGLALVRDYGLFDMTMLRFARKGGRRVGPRLYRRADGTLARFFEAAQVRAHQ
jgi:hypothetical protein